MPLINNIAGLFNRPLALLPQEAETLAAALRGDVKPAAFGGYQRRDPDRNYGLLDGVAVIPVRGVLSNDDHGDWGGTGYGWIRVGFLAAIADPEVRAIAFDVDSPGGAVEGCFDLVDTIYAARGAKPIWAILSESAYSAAYAIASAADRVVVPRTGGTGSIGVICMYADFSQALGDAGVKVSIFRYGARKAEGLPYETLSEEAAAAIQADVDAIGELFVATVARNRGADAARIRATQAATFMGGCGVGCGLADAVMAPDAAFRALLDTLG